MIGRFKPQLSTQPMSQYQLNQNDVTNIETLIQIDAEPRTAARSSGANIAGALQIIQISAPRSDWRISG
ncbi:MAG: hypothetical protein FJW38_12555 [Acidobacteria bacterium]|nr:hypothetical protein [Acidobacteriota bacterium]